MDIPTRMWAFMLAIIALQTPPRLEASFALTMWTRPIGRVISTESAGLQCDILSRRQSPPRPGSQRTICQCLPDLRKTRRSMQMIQLRDLQPMIEPAAVDGAALSPLWGLPFARMLASSLWKNRAVLGSAICCAIRRRPRRGQRGAEHRACAARRISSFHYPADRAVYRRGRFMHTRQSAWLSGHEYGTACSGNAAGERDGHHRRRNAADSSIAARKR